VLLSLGAFKTPIKREEPGDSHPVINDWGQARAVPGQIKVVPELKQGQSEM
jgi:hypothetical protein